MSEDFVALSDEEYDALSPLEKGRYKRALNRYLGIASQKKSITAKVYRNAIKAFCLHCVGDCRKTVANCTSKDCPLYHLRPYKNPKVLVDTDEEQQ